MLVISIFFLMFSIAVKATENEVLYTKSSLSFKDDKQITLKIYINTDKEISGALIPWSFDKTKLEVASVKSSKFSVTYRDLEGKITKNIVLDTAKEYTGEIELFEITFNVLSGFKEGEKTNIIFDVGQIANYKKTYKSDGALFEVERIGNRINIEYDEITTPKIVNTVVQNAKLASASELASNENTEKVKENNDNKVEAIDTGYVIPSISLSLLGIGFIGFKTAGKKRGLLYRV